MTAHRAEAWLYGIAATACAYAATGTTLNGSWPWAAMFIALAGLLARVSYREQHAARRARDEAVRAELLARPGQYRPVIDPIPDVDGVPLCVCGIDAVCSLHANPAQEIDQ